jgi:hypothetical protein
MRTSPKITHHRKKWAAAAYQGVGPESNPNNNNNNKKKPNTKKGWRVAQIVEHLPMNPEALSSAPAPPNFLKVSQHNNWSGVPHSVFGVYTNNEIFVTLFSLKV